MLPVMQNGSHAPTLTQRGASRYKAAAYVPCRKTPPRHGQTPPVMVGFFVSCNMQAYPDIDLVERILPDIREGELLYSLMHDVAWRDEQITIFGKTMMQPRRIAWYGDRDARYTYSGIAHEPLPWIPILQTLRGVVEEIAGAHFNSVLCNLYRSGQDSMGYHSDDEPELGRHPVIASFSIGAERALHFRHRTDASIPTVKVVLPSMSVLVMKGVTQEQWKHALPKTKVVVAPRINLTFRQVHQR